ncbi:coiled-coil and C2 domain-containing protein 1A [Ditylenchus destructor]|nr:coiled-coil and C2 domain-containing protein 1A [Ditylenchus destructor]
MTYGDVENDEELLEELYRLENEGKSSSSKGQSSSNRRLAQANQHSGEKRKATVQQSSHQVPANLLNSDLVDDHEIDDDVDLDDENLLSELNELVGEGGDELQTNLTQEEFTAELAPPPLPKRRVSPAPPPSIPQRNHTTQLPEADARNASMSENWTHVEKPDVLENVLPAVPPRVSTHVEEESQHDILSTLVQCKAYYEAELANAVKAQDSLKERRIQRTLTKVSDLQKKANRGLAVDPDSIPPFSKLSLQEKPRSEPTPSTRPAPQETAQVMTTNDSSAKTDEVSKQAENILRRRRDLYMANAVAAKEAKDKMEAAAALNVVKMFQEAIDAVKGGAQLTMDDLKEIPPSPPPYKRQDVPKSLLEDLEARENKFKELAAQFKEAGDDSKSRMQGRLLTLMQTAIVKYKKGQPINLEALPTPIGFKPLGSSDYGYSTNAPETSKDKVGAKVDKEVLAPKAVLNAEQINQVKALITRQVQYKRAAMDAKNKGDIVAAMGFLKKAKSLDEAIKSIQSAGPTKTSEMPRKSADTQKIVSVSSRTGTTGLSATLEKELLKQVTLCDNSITQFRQLGDAKSATFYEKLLAGTKEDVNRLQQALIGGTATPQYQLLDISIPVLDSNASIPENVLELKIKNIEKLKLPEGWTPPDCAIFVTYNFPFPHENHQLGRTSTVKGTNNPEFSDVLRLDINRKSRQLLRLIKRMPLKLEVYQKGSFFRSDKMWAHADVSLSDLENSASVEKQVDLLEGRRKTGGTIKIELCISRPLGEGHPTSTVQRKWVKLTANTVSKRAILLIFAEINGAVSIRHHRHRVQSEAVNADDLPMTPNTPTHPENVLPNMGPVNRPTGCNNDDSTSNSSDEDDIWDIILEYCGWDDTIETQVEDSAENNGDQNSSLKVAKIDVADPPTLLRPDPNSVIADRNVIFIDNISPNDLSTTPSPNELSNEGNGDSDDICEEILEWIADYTSTEEDSNGDSGDIEVDDNVDATFAKTMSDKQISKTIWIRQMAVKMKKITTGMRKFLKAVKRIGKVEHNEKINN